MDTGRMGDNENEQKQNDKEAHENILYQMSPDRRGGLCPRAIKKWFVKFVDAPRLKPVRSAAIG